MIDFAIEGKDKLGFEEIYFQFCLRPDARNLLCFPLEQEAFLEQGYHVKFGVGNTFESSTPIAKMPKKLMRPTFVQVNRQAGEYDYYAVGGDQERSINRYSLRKDTWTNVGSLPEGHNLCVSVACNYDNKAVYTFMCDERMNLKVAMIDVNKDLAEKECHPWAFKCEREKHKIDRFHVKCATALPSRNEIHVVARGRLENMREQITTLILVFKVSNDGLKITSSDDKLSVLRLWPIIFPRQLDYMESNGKWLYMVQDTPDNEPFEVVAADVTTKRRDGVHQAHHIRELMYKGCNE